MENRAVHDTTEQETPAQTAASDVSTVESTMNAHDSTARNEGESNLTTSLSITATESPSQDNNAKPEDHPSTDTAMDIDSEVPAATTEPTLDNDSANTVKSTEDRSLEAPKELIKEQSTPPALVSTTASDASHAEPVTDSAPLTKAAEVDNSGADASSETAIKSSTQEPVRTEGHSSKDAPATDQKVKSPKDATAHTPAPSSAARAYTPQFKFTTFSPMVTLPTRNILSNYVKSEKNFVLKDIAAAGDKTRRNKKRKTANEQPQQGSQQGDQEGWTEEGAQGGDSDKRKLAQGNQEDQGESQTSNRSNGGEDDNESSDSSSDSDSEESVIDEMDEDAEVKESAEMGKKVIVIHPGSRFVRIGRASDAYPVVTPHVIARRMRTGSNSNQVGKNASKESGAPSTTDDSSAMDVDDDDQDDRSKLDVVNDRFLQEIEYDLKQRMKAAKRKPVASAKSQVRSFNSSTQPERILDHNDPYKVEWTDPKAEGEFVIGQKALNLPPGNHHTFKLFWPIVGGHFNDRDYTSPRVATADLETIWTKVIQDDLGIERSKFRKHYALLIIPDLFNKLYVVELVGMLLKSMQFKGVMVQQESVCASFGAGVSAACVVDIGAEVTKIACVEDGVCIPNSRAVLKYGGDDITRCFSALVRRNDFPYAELDLNQNYDWKLMEDLKEKWCTMDEADLTVQVYSFFVRKPDHQTEKYQTKVYDEVALSPMCLFFPGVIRRWIEEREVNPVFTRLINYEEINDDAPPISLVNQASKKGAAAAVAAAARAGTPSSTIAGDDNPAGGQVNGNSTPLGSTPAATPAPLAIAPTAAVAPSVVPFQMEPSVTTTDVPWEIAGTIGKDHFSSLVALDVVVAQSISNCESEERSKKLYGSIILVGGGGMIKGFDHVLEDRLFQALPATLTTVEKVEVLPSPREMDPRLLVWKGGSVLGKLETAKELWIKPLEWELLGHKILRDRALFVW
ncbi:actin-like protein arp8 [Podila epigama]|nr:actin-like protein arp8 [Podila epigama]